MENPITKEDYEEARKKAKRLYKKVGRVWSPALNDYIAFNSTGFRHLVWKGSERRPHSQQLSRFSLLPKVSDILADPDIKTVFRTKKEYSVIKWRGKKKVVVSEAKFWAFAKEIDEKSIRAVIRQVGKGQKHFLSVFEEKKNKQKTTPE